MIKEIEAVEPWLKRLQAQLHLDFNTFCDIEWMEKINGLH